MDDGAGRGAHRTRETNFSERKIKIGNNIDNNSIKHIYNTLKKKREKKLHKKNERNKYSIKL